MAFNAFLQIDGISGEATDSDHQEWIQVHSYNIGVVNAGAGIGGAGGHAQGRADFSDFTISKNLDLASPSLVLACAKGDPLGKIVFSVCQAAGDKTEYLNVELTDAMITGVSQSGGGDVPMEDVSIKYSTIKWVYTHIGQDQQPVGDASAGWNVSECAEL